MSSLAPAQISKLNSKLNKSSRADARISMQLFKAGRMMIFTLFHLPNQSRYIFHIPLPIFKIPRLLRAGDPVKTLTL